MAWAFRLWNAKNDVRFLILFVALLYGFSGLQIFAFEARFLPMLCI